MLNFVLFCLIATFGVFYLAAAVVDEYMDNATVCDMLTIIHSQV